MSFINDELRIPVTTKTLSAHLQRKDFVYSPALPRDSVRVDIERRDVEQYYNDLETQLNGVHPGLVFNMDEMGVEMFADKKRCACLSGQTKSHRAVLCKWASQEQEEDAPWSRAYHPTAQQ